MALVLQIFIRFLTSNGPKFWDHQVNEANNLCREPLSILIQAFFFLFTSIQGR